MRWVQIQAGAFICRISMFSPVSFSYSLKGVRLSVNGCLSLCVSFLPSDCWDRPLTLNWVNWNIIPEWILFIVMCFFFLSPTGRCWYPLLCWSLCLHYIWWLWSLLWRCVHSYPSGDHHCSWSPSIHHWANWMLRYSEGELLWTYIGQ